VAIRSGLGLVCAFILARCASATAIRVERSDVVGPCLTAVPDRDVLLGVALSGGGSRAALFGAAGLEALAGLRTADGASVIDRITHVSSVSGGSIAATYYALTTYQTLFLLSVEDDERHVRDRERPAGPAARVRIHLQAVTSGLGGPSRPP